MSADSRSVPPAGDTTAPSYEELQRRLNDTATAMRQFRELLFTVSDERARLRAALAEATARAEKLNKEADDAQWAFEASQRALRALDARIERLRAQAEAARRDTIDQLRQAFVDGAEWGDGQDPLLEQDAWDEACKEFPLAARACHPVEERE